jgi:hypothetical protein
MVEMLKGKCNVEIPISAQHIILGSDITLLIYSLFSLRMISTICRFYGQKTCVSDLINILKCTYETEIQSASIYQTPVIRERIGKILR